MGGVAASAYTAGMFLVAAVVESVCLLFEADRGGLTGQEWVWLACLGVVLGASMGFMTWAQRHTNVAISSVLSLGSTVITAIGAWVFFDQSLNGVQIVGGVVVLASLGGIVVGQVAGAAGEARDVVLAEPAWLPEPPDERALGDPG
jgi:drug/metabolite transporter (DMT)-like permease